MHDPAIRLRFPDVRAAGKAFETLQELGYRPVMIAACEPPQLAVHIDGSDVQSALEIAHAFDGHLAEEGDLAADATAMDPDAAPIPAHIVTEDFPDDYMSGTSGGADEDEIDAAVRSGYRDSVY